MSTMGKDLGRGCGRAALIQLIAVAVGLPLGCILVGVPLWLIATFGGQAWMPCSNHWDSPAALT